MKDSGMDAISSLLETWDDNGSQIKDAFVGLKEYIESGDGVSLSCVARPGISYSLRAMHESQKVRGLYAMVDVIDDDPADRWLSVCFYGEMIQDPEGLGDEVPEGLLGEDACCFDIDENDESLVSYVKTRLEEARLSASREA